MSHSHTQSPDVINRLARIEGHVKAVKKMAEEGKPCAEVLHQIAAVEAALRKVAKIVLENHLDHCIGDNSHPDELKAMVDELKDVIATYLR